MSRSTSATVNTSADSFGKQSEGAGALSGLLAWIDAAHIDVLVVADMDEEAARRLQAAPGAVVAQHGPHQFQARPADRQRHRRVDGEPVSPATEYPGPGWKRLRRADLAQRGGDPIEVVRLPWAP
ncbi:hypothetical protein Psi01_65870 [Planobispora siamensis]|uniref:Uncharacterized protein n=1 Tax=Planobispora siamensis TaxID=936338 RepID=A0A8J3WPQ6_9ACTN|nr:hypothetical protein Psi01_65870 [Planobispora siamensis]